MNVFIHQNNETAGPYDERTLRGMLDSGEILLLTFARLEGEAGWRPLSEIIPQSDEPAPPPALDPVLRSPPPPLAGSPGLPENAAPAQSAGAARVLEANPSNTLKIACPSCGQHILVDQSHSGMTGVCPTCGGPVVIPATVGALPTMHIAKAGQPARGGMHGLASRLTGLRPLEGFKISNLFSDVFKNRPRADFEALFNTGLSTRAPGQAALTAGLPRPWFYLRMLIFGALVLFALAFGYEKFPDAKFLPALLAAGAFLVPLCCVALFFELDATRSISIYHVAKLIVGGAILSLPVALFLARHAKPDFAGTLLSGLLLEIAQVLIAVALLRATNQYQWILNGLLAGAAVGAGFAGIESASYLFYAFLDDVQRGDSKLTTYYAILRAQAGFVPLCHLLWTAVLTGALWRAKGEDAFHPGLFFRRPFLRILIVVGTLEAFWNAGLLWTSIWKLSLVRVEQGLWVLSILGTCWLALLMVQEGLRQAGELSIPENRPEDEKYSKEASEFAG